MILKILMFLFAIEHTQEKTYNTLGYVIVDNYRVRLIDLLFRPAIIWIILFYYFQGGC